MLNIEIGGMGVTRALCDRFEHRATEKILARFDFLSEIFRPLSDIKVMSWRRNVSKLVEGDARENRR